MALLDLQKLELSADAERGNSRASHSCGHGGVSGLSLLLCAV